MLFYNQLKREFSQPSWKSGQNLFRADAVKSVKLEENLLTGKIQAREEDPSLDVAVVMARGTIAKAQCSCSNKNQRPYCDHVAALSIFMVERGSLLRAGITEDEENPEAEKPIQRDTVSAEPVAFVRGIFTDGNLGAISIEPSLRYTDPSSKKTEVITLNRLVRQYEAHTWRTPQGIYLKLIREDLPILERVDAAKVYFQGQSALDNLARLLMDKTRSQVVFHEAVNLEVDRDPLVLTSLKIGKKTDKSRVVSYEFKNETVTFDSEELAELAKVGRLSSQYVWRGNKIYRFETPLTVLSQYANRSGVAAAENEGPLKTDGFAHLYDDDKHPLHPLAAYRLSLELGVKKFVVDSDWKEFHEWQKQFEKKRTAALPEVEYGFGLRDYQTNGLSWIWSLYHRGLAALLADDMGLGKTHQVLAFLTTIYRGQKTRPNLPTLVVAPTSVVAAWSQKLQKYDTGLTCHIFHGNTRTLPAANVHVVLTTYGILQREPALRARQWHCVILDEAQAIKNATTINSRASRALISKFRIAMTGTPVENQPTDLWSIMEFLLPGYLGSLPRFKRLYGSGRDVPTKGQSDALKRIVAPFLLRRTKSQVLKELPEKIEEVISCEMSVEQKKAYNAVLRGAEAARAREDLASDGKKVNYANILALLTKLKQICDHPKLPALTAGKIKSIKTMNPAESGKWEVFDELVQEAIRSSLKVVVFTQYLGMMDIIGHYLKSQGIGYTDLRGDTQDRSSRLDRFASDPECKVFVCSLLAGGLGIDLTSASVCIHVDRWWNPAKENQATDRLHRYGQTRGVQVFKLQIPGTVEDRIADIIQSKTALSGSLIEESDVTLKAFSRKQLLDLLSADIRDIE